jgi:hypothetical protein
MVGGDYSDIFESRFEPGDCTGDDDDIGSLGSQLASGAPPHALRTASYEDGLVRANQQKLSMVTCQTYSAGNGKVVLVREETHSIDGKRYSKDGKAGE